MPKLFIYLYFEIEVTTFVVWILCRLVCIIVKKSHFGPCQQYILRDNAKATSGKDKSTYILVPKQDDQHLSDKSVTSAAACGNGELEEESGMFKN